MTIHGSIANATLLHERIVLDNHAGRGLDADCKAVLVAKNHKQLFLCPWLSFKVVRNADYRKPRYRTRIKRQGRQMPL